MSKTNREIFTEDLIRKSEHELDSASEIEFNFRIFITDESLDGLTEEEHTNQLMNYFMNQDSIRPEILLSKNSELTELAFPTEKHENVFRDVLTKYQEDEQILHVNKKYGVEIDDSIYDSSKIMMYRSPSFSNRVIQSKVETCENILSKAYSNVQRMNDKGEYTLFTNSADIIADYSDMELVSSIDFEPLKENYIIEPPLDPQNNLVLGAPYLSQDLAKVPKQLNDDYDLKKKTDKEILKLEDPVKLAKEHSQRMKELYLEPFDMIKGGLFQNGILQGEFKKNPITRSINRAHLGASPSPDLIKAGLMHVEPKTVLNFPYSEQNVANFKAALLDIQADGAFDLNEIKFARKKELEPFKKALEEVMANQFALGKANKNDLSNDNQENDQDQRNIVEQDNEPEQPNVIEQENEQEQSNDIELENELENEQSNDVEQEDVLDEDLDQELDVDVQFGEELELDYHQSSLNEFDEFDDEEPTFDNDDFLEGLDIDVEEMTDGIEIDADEVLEYEEPPVFDDDEIKNTVNDVLEDEENEIRNELLQELEKAEAQSSQSRNRVNSNRKYKR